MFFPYISKEITNPLLFINLTLRMFVVCCCYFISFHSARKHIILDLFCNIWRKKKRNEEEKKKKERERETVWFTPISLDLLTHEKTPAASWVPVFRIRFVSFLVFHVYKLCWFRYYLQQTTNIDWCFLLYVMRFFPLSLSLF